MMLSELFVVCLAGSLYAVVIGSVLFSAAVRRYRRLDRVNVYIRLVDRYGPGIVTPGSELYKNG